jgi:hypothetical protein
VQSALVGVLAGASADDFAKLAADLAMNEALPRGAGPLLTALSGTRDPLREQLLTAMVGRSHVDDGIVAAATQLDAKSPALHAAVAQLLAGESVLGASALPLAKRAALDAALDAKIRASLLGAIAQAPGQQALDAATAVFAQVNPVAPVVVTATTAAAPAAATPAASADPVEAAWRRFVGDRRRMTELDYFVTKAKSAAPAERTLAYAVLLQSIRSPRVSPAVREKVAPVIEAGWTDPASAPSLVQAVNVMHLESQYGDKLAAHGKGQGK